MRRIVEERFKRGLFGLWCLGWLGVFWLSLRPIAGMPYGLSDKGLHFLGYAVMAAGVAGFAHERRQLVGWVGLSVALGGLVELAQHFQPMRSMELLDFLADAGGAALGGLLALAWLTLVVRPLRRAA